GDLAAPVVADEVETGVAEGVHDPDRVGDQQVGGVVLGPGRARASGIAALVRGDGAVAGGAQRLELRAPHAPRLGEAVQQQRRLAIRRPCDVDGEREVAAADLLGLDAHGTMLTLWVSPSTPRAGLSGRRRPLATSARRPRGPFR